MRRSFGALAALILVSCNAGTTEFPQLILRCSSSEEGIAGLPNVDMSIITDTASKSLYYTTIAKNVAARSNSVKVSNDKVEAGMTDIQSGNADDLIITYDKNQKTAELFHKSTGQKFNYKCIDLPESSLNSEMMAMDAAFLEIKSFSEEHIN